MDKYTLGEVAYKNGFEAGVRKFADELKEEFEGLSQDIEKVFKRVADFNTCDINTIIDSVRDKLIKEVEDNDGK